MQKRWDNQGNDFYLPLETYEQLIGRKVYFMRLLFF